MKDDPTGRVACETMVATGLAMVAGEITTTCEIDYQKIVRGTIEKIGYVDAAYGYDFKTCAVLSWWDGNLRHCDGGRYGWCRGPGDDVRLCHERDAGTHARTHSLGA